MGRQSIVMTPEATDAVRTLGAQIRARRAALSMTAEELAARASVSARTVSLVEQGRASVSIGNVFNIATVIGVPLFGTADGKTLALIADGAQARTSSIHRVHPPSEALIKDSDVDF